ncbi:MAG: hypothetical protein M1820_007254 [Bogoriella megaspora]|nr:MAG: hypothetical protein M1820_007254 [Bogoriella megaspora]
MNFLSPRAHLGRIPSNDYQLQRDRQRNNNRLERTFQDIYEKYERDFTRVGDEIDLETGEIVVDNGHLALMEDEHDVGHGQARSFVRAFTANLMDEPSQKKRKLSVDSDNTSGKDEREGYESDDERVGNTFDGGDQCANGLKTRDDGHGNTSNAPERFAGEGDGKALSHPQQASYTKPWLEEPLKLMKHSSTKRKAPRPLTGKRGARRQRVNDLGDSSDDDLFGDIRSPIRRRRTKDQTSAETDIKELGQAIAMQVTNFMTQRLQKQDGSTTRRSAPKSASNRRRQQPTESSRTLPVDPIDLIARAMTPMQNHFGQLTQSPKHRSLWASDKALTPAADVRRRYALSQSQRLLSERHESITQDVDEFTNSLLRHATAVMDGVEDAEIDDTEVRDAATMKASNSASEDFVNARRVLAPEHSHSANIPIVHQHKDTNDPNDDVNFDRLDAVDDDYAFENLRRELDAAQDTPYDSVEMHGDDNETEYSANTKRPLGRLMSLEGPNWRWTKEEDDLLLHLKHVDLLEWPDIVKRFPSRSYRTIQQRYYNLMKPARQDSELRRELARQIAINKLLMQENAKHARRISRQRLSGDESDDGVEDLDTDDMNTEDGQTELDFDSNSIQEQTSRIASPTEDKYPHINVQGLSANLDDVVHHPDPENYSPQDDVETYVDCEDSVYHRNPVINASVIEDANIDPVLASMTQSDLDVQGLSLAHSSNVDSLPGAYATELCDAADTENERCGATYPSDDDSDGYLFAPREEPFVANHPDDIDSSEVLETQNQAELGYLDNDHFKKWACEEDELLLRLRYFEQRKWPEIAPHFPRRTFRSLQQRYYSLGKPEIYMDEERQWQMYFDGSADDRDETPWREDEDETLLHFREVEGLGWETIAEKIPERDDSAIRKRYLELTRIPNEEQLDIDEEESEDAESGQQDTEPKNRPHGWTSVELAQLRHLKEVQHMRWDKIAKKFPTRSQKQIRQRYYVLRDTPRIDQGPDTGDESLDNPQQSQSRSWEPDEEWKLYRMRDLEKKSWNEICAEFPYRTRGAVQFRYYTVARGLGAKDSNIDPALRASALETSRAESQERMAREPSLTRPITVLDRQSRSASYDSPYSSRPPDALQLDGTDERPRRKILFGEDGYRLLRPKGSEPIQQPNDGSNEDSPQLQANGSQMPFQNFPITPGSGRNVFHNMQGSPISQMPSLQSVQSLVSRTGLEGSQLLQYPNRIPTTQQTPPSSTDSLSRTLGMAGSQPLYSSHQKSPNMHWSSLHNVGMTNQNAGPLLTPLRNVPKTPMNWRMSMQSKGIDADDAGIDLLMFAPKSQKKPSPQQRPPPTDVQTLDTANGARAPVAQTNLQEPSHVHLALVDPVNILPSEAETGATPEPTLIPQESLGNQENSQSCAQTLAEANGADKPVTEPNSREASRNDSTPPSSVPTLANIVSRHPRPAPNSQKLVEDERPPQSIGRVPANVDQVETPISEFNLKKRAKDGEPDLDSVQRPLSEADLASKEPEPEAASTPAPALQEPLEYQQTPHSIQDPAQGRETDTPMPQSDSRQVPEGHSILRGGPVSSGKVREPVRLSTPTQDSRDSRKDLQPRFVNDMVTREARPVIAQAKMKNVASFPPAKVYMTPVPALKSKMYMTPVRSSPAKMYLKPASPAPARMHSKSTTPVAAPVSSKTASPTPAEQLSRPASITAMPASRKSKSTLSRQAGNARPEHQYSGSEDELAL